MYLQIDYKIKDTNYTMFINTSKQTIEHDIKALIYFARRYENFEITKVQYTKTTINNW